MPSLPSPHLRPLTVQSPVRPTVPFNRTGRQTPPPPPPPFRTVIQVLAAVDSLHAQLEADNASVASAPHPAASLRLHMLSPTRPVSIPSPFATRRRGLETSSAAANFAPAASVRTEADPQPFTGAREAELAASASTQRAPFPAPYTSRSSPRLSPQRDYVTHREWSPSINASGFVGEAALSPTDFHADSRRFSSSSSASASATASSPRVLFSQLVSQGAREIGLVSVTPDRLARVLASAATRLGRITAPDLVNALINLSVLAQGMSSTAAVRDAAEAFVGSVWVSLEFVASGPSARPLATGEVDFRLATTALLPLLGDSTASARMELAWNAFADSGRLTERALSRFLGALVAGADAAARVGAAVLRASPPADIDAAASGRALAALAFRDLMPAGAPAAMVIGDFAGWCRMRNVDVMCAAAVAAASMVG